MGSLGWLPARGGTVMSAQGNATPLISVVIPAYNFGHLIGYTLDSLLAQTYPHWECVVVDDGSKDNTDEVMARYMASDNRFKYHKQVNSGPAKARNAGIKLATGDYLQFLDADDLLQPDKMQAQVNVISEHPEADVVYGPVFHFSTQGLAPDKIGELGPDTVERPTVSGSGNDVTKAFLVATISVNASLVKRELALKLNLLDESLIQSEDWDFYLQAAFQGAVFYYRDLPDGARALIRKHDDNNTRDYFRLQYYVVKMRQKFASLCTDPELLALNQYWMLKNLEDLIFQIQADLASGMRKRAIQRSFKAYELHPTPRYLVYALASIFVPTLWYKKITSFSFSNLLNRKG